MFIFCCLDPRLREDDDLVRCFMFHDSWYVYQRNEDVTYE